ncbi:hypothetical protein [Aureimonas sp. Leaf454]|uniref:hypothetical protein n=1 Tax=Aureimonas sp. Leaf454 TaxID=1736381 RepID=UPI000B0954BB|nr:hypothetical protein [Aureimonas sp. Leaf454]
MTPREHHASAALQLIADRQRYTERQASLKELAVGAVVGATSVLLMWSVFG